MAKTITKTELMKMVGHKVKIQLFDDTEYVGILGFTKEFSSKYGYRKPNYFTINDIDFKVSHIKRIEWAS